MSVTATFTAADHYAPARGAQVGTTPLGYFPALAVPITNVAAFFNGVIRNSFCFVQCSLMTCQKRRRWLAVSDNDCAALGRVLIDFAFDTFVMGSFELHRKVPNKARSRPNKQKAAARLNPATAFSGTADG